MQPKQNKQTKKNHQIQTSKISDFISLPEGVYVLCILKVHTDTIEVS